MWEEAIVPGENPLVQAGDNHTLSRTTTVDHGDHTRVAEQTVITNKVPKNTALDMANKEKTIPRPLPAVPTDIKEKFPKQQSGNPHRRDNLPTEFYRNSENRTGHTLLALKGILLIAAIVLISSTKEISIAKPCGLERVLVSLVVDHTSICKYDGIKKMSTTLCNVGISFLVLNAFSFLLILNFLWVPTNKMRVCIALLVSVTVASAYSVLMIHSYTKVLDSKERQTETNYARIKSSMISRLEENYTSDNVTSGDAISDMWNKFFIEYECCAIDQVTGTNNNFDRTPWCTTSGSCQTTASQIPKTCCNYVTEDNYQSAPTACHSSVNSGTYKSNCMMAIKKLSTVHIKEYHVSLLLITLMTVGTLEIAECLLEGILIYRIVELWNLKKQLTF